MSYHSTRKRFLRTASLAAGITGLLASAAAFADPSLQPQLERRAALIAQQSKAPATPPELLQARVTAESRSGVRRLRIRDFQYLSDSGRDFGGYNLGAGSWDTEVAVLASAIADEFAIQAAEQKIPVDGIAVEFTSYPDDPAIEKARKVAYPRNLAYVAYIDSKATDAQLEGLRQSVEKTSPVLNLISKGYPIPHGEIVLKPSPATRDAELPPGLRDFLVEKRGAILRRDKRAATNPPKPYALRAVATVEPATGIRTTRTGDGNFQIVHDSRKELGGYGLAPTVEEHQVGVLGTCLTHIFEIQAATKQVVLDSLEVRVEGKLTPRIGAGATQPPRYQDLKYTVHIESPASAAEIDGLRQAVEATCPVYNLLKDGQAVKGSLVRGRYADVAKPAS
ncbi:MAG: OsmC family protein [Sphingopyxis sp.]|nr:OsmC family protein [Sphingopyxis sp.]